LHAFALALASAISQLTSQGWQPAHRPTKSNKPN
jgi:hypothetical protein